MEVTINEVERAVGKRNWSGPGRDKIRNFWWKKIIVLHGHIPGCLEEIIKEDNDMDLEWFVMGKTTMIPKAAEWNVASPCPITLLNTCYKCPTSVLKVKIDHTWESMTCFNAIRGEAEGAPGG